MAADRSPLTLVDDGRIDRDALDAAAALAVAGLVVDLAGAEQRAVQRRRDAVRRRLALVAVAAAVILLSFTLTPAATLVPPLPASVPSGPATLPRTVEQAPQWIPAADQDPIGRALLVLQTDLILGPQSEVNRTYSEPVLVGADGDGYRRLPSVGQVRTVALSPDGRRVAWSDNGGDTPAGVRIAILDLRSGTVSAQSLVGRFGRGVAVQTLAFSPDGSRLAVGGGDQFAGGSSPAVYLLDGVGGRLMAGCRCGGAVVWSADGRLLTATGAVPVPDEGLLPGGGTMPAIQDGLISNQRLDGMQLQSAALGVDGAERYWVDAIAPTRDEATRAWLQRTRLDGRSDRVAELGPAQGAQALAVVDRGVLVSRWRSGGGELVAVQDGGRVEVLTRSSGPAVIAVAAGLVTGARPGPAAQAPTGWRSVAWYRWEAARAWHRFPQTWGTLLTLVVLVTPVLIMLQVIRPLRRRLPGLVPPVARLADRAGPMLARTPVIGAAAAIGAGSLLAGIVLPTQAAPVMPSGGARTPVVPSEVRVQALLPPRAYDAVGQPRTRRISMLFGVYYAGNQRLIGVDGDTGRLVRLDDLPGLSQTGQADATLFLMSGTQSGGISPNGRFVALGPLVIDLQTATSRTVAEAGQSSGGAAVTDDGTLLAVVPGTGNRVTIARPGERGRTLEGSDGSYALESSAAGYVITRFSGGSTDTSQDLVDLIDPVNRRYLGRLKGVGPSAPVTVVGRPGEKPTVVDVDATGQVRVGGRALRSPGSVDRFAGGVDGALVGYGYGGPGTPYAVLRAGAGDDELTAVTRVEPLDGGLQQAPALAGGLISQARVVDVPLPAWDGWFRWRDELRVLGLVLLLAMAIGVQLRRRDRSAIGR